MAGIGGAKNVDEGVIGNFMAARFNSQGNLAAFIPSIDEGLLWKPCTRVEGACASGALALATRQQLDDATPEDQPTRVKMLGAIIAHCQSASAMLDEQSKRIAGLRDLEKSAPDTLAALPKAIEALKGRLPAVKSALTTLNTNRLAFRLANTTNSLKQLTTAPHAILLANAFIDTDAQLDLKIPAHLRSAGDPGSYIVQARGLITEEFRQALAAAGAAVISYVPNNAYLVRASADVAGKLRAAGVKAAAYHAGLSSAERTRTAKGKL